MITKYLTSISIFSLMSISVLQAADVTIPEQPVPIITAPQFSWTGFYLGGQIGNFSSKIKASYLKDEDAGQWSSVRKEDLPKLSGFIGGIYAGYNIGINNGFIIGIDTDLMWVNKKDTKDHNLLQEGHIEEASSKSKIVTVGTSGDDEDHSASFDEVVYHTLKQKWAGATRVRFGFSFDRLMPYVAGGVAYTQLNNIISNKSNTEKKAGDLAKWVYDEKKTMIGYTLGGGVDFAMTDNILLRAEYRYSDFGKKKFVKDNVEMGYKTNDFRVGVAYKF
ncbi:porin family protein [Bartonella krasnovii]|uniref:outer membrane protein n=1 Tax=Bartonella krasnovii TaxID=2267275 RepID=UPI001F4CD3CB|nr:outer membrane protein [Bartonella krasnovii]UNF44275.1 porin family protein [Bartonella krasnovii]